MLGLLDEGVDLLQALQVPHRRAQEQAERQVYVIDEAHAALLVERHEVEHHVGLVEADGDGHVALVNDTQRHGGVGRARAYLLHIGYAQDDEHPTVVVLVAGTLVGIADVTDEIVGNVEALFEFALIVLCRTRHLYPTVRLPLRQVGKIAGSVPVCLHFANPPLVLSVV